MKKHFVSTLLVTGITFASLGVPSFQPFSNPIEVSAATISNYNNQQAVNVKADAIIKTAKSLVGKATYANVGEVDYNSLKFRCASFVHYVFLQNGIDLSTANETYMFEQGIPVSRNQLQKGDLIFFDNNKSNSDPTDHIGIYIGDNKIIHAANTKLDITISDLDSTSFYRDNYVGARRVLPSMLSQNPATQGDKVVELAFDLKDDVTMGSTNNTQSLKFTGAGFVNYVYGKAGVKLGTTSMSEQMKLGKDVARKDLKKGDLIFFNSKAGSSTPTTMAIYAGDQRIIVPTPSGILTRVLLVDYYNKGYIKAKRVIGEGTTSPTTSPIPEPTPTPDPTDTNEPAATTKADQIVNFSKGQIGKATFGYKYDVNSHTFTGAGFTYYVYSQMGIDLKDKVASRQATIGQAVQKNNLQKGDLVYFSLNNSGTKITHSGIYIGDNQVLHLSVNNGVVIQNLDSDWAQKNYVTARRVL